MQKYIEVVANLLDLYQQALLCYLRNEPPNVSEFKRQFQETMSDLKKVESGKAVEHRVSERCVEMIDFCDSYQRVNKTSLIPHRAQRPEVRQNMKSQGGQRFLFNSISKKEPSESQTIDPVTLDTVAKSYKLRQDGPIIRMKWKSVREGAVKQDSQDNIVDNSNIDMLAYTIPELQNSIYRLTQTRNLRMRKQANSINSRSARHEKAQPQLSLSQDWKKKYHIPRLF